MFALIISVIVGIIVSGFSGVLLYKSSQHRYHQKQKISNLLNGIIGAFIFFCVSLFVYVLLIKF